MTKSSWQDQRQYMLSRDLVGRGITDRQVLQAMGSVPREQFVSAEWRDEAYHDCALPIEAGQTISQPYTVAFMAALAQLKPTDRVLEIGTGSGYGAAILSRLVQEVHSVERIPWLAEQARRRLVELGSDNVAVHCGDGTQGLPEFAPYDAILVTAAPPEIPPSYAEQLKPGGRLVIPVGSCADNQQMYRLTRTPSGMQTESFGAFSFVPLVSSS